MSRCVADLMTRKLTTLGPALTLTQMDRVLLDAHISGAPVVDRGKLVGIVSRSDVIHMLYEEQKKQRQVSGFYTSPVPIGISALEHLARDSREIAERMASTRVGDIMTTEVETVAPDDSVQMAAKLMCEKGFHRVPVVEDGRLVGILSSLDVVRVVADGT